MSSTDQHSVGRPSAIHLRRGRYVHRLLHDPSWKIRRVETVSFPNTSTVNRHNTIDVDVDSLLKVAPTSESRQGTLFAPLTVIRKQLFRDFDLRDASGSVLPVVSRREDSYLAWCSAIAVLDQLGFRLESFPSQLLDRIYAIIYEFPGDREMWRPAPTWRARTTATWSRLAQNDEFRDFLSRLKDNFLLVTKLTAKPGVQVVKFRYQESWTLADLRRGQSIGWEPVGLQIPVPAIGLSASYHIRVDMPPGLSAISSELVCELADRYSHRPATGKPTSNYESVLAEQRASLYVREFTREPGEYQVRVGTRIPLPGFIRSALITSILTTGLFALGAIFHRRLQTADSDAAVAFVLAIPLVLQVFLVRPEHPLPTTISRRLRYFILALLILTYLATATVVLGVYGTALVIWWSALGGLSMIVTTLFGIVAWKTRDDDRKARCVRGTTRPGLIKTVREPDPTDSLQL